MNRAVADREFLLRMLRAALARSQADACLADHLPPPPKGRVLVLGGGKAAGAMAAAFDAAWDAGPCTGLVVAPYGYARPAGRIRVVEAGHPVPDEAGLRAAAEMLAMAGELGADDLAVVLLSGGGSALLTCPAPGLTLADKQDVTRQLLRSGAPIQDINAVRRRLSAIKGGGLARAAFPAKVVTLAISDVVGDDPAVIASGPTVADPDPPDRARALLQKWGVTPPLSVRHLLAPSPQKIKPEPGPAPKPAPKPEPGGDYRLIARPRAALDAAAALATAAGFAIVDLGDALEGEAAAVARAHAALALRLRRRPGAHVILSGGELTVTLAAPATAEGGAGGEALGGPNREYAMSLALALDGAEGIAAIAADTDGQDGVGAAAGALIDPTTPTRAAALGIDLAACLVAHDTHRGFAHLGDLVETGPTFTNVNDFRAIIVRPSGLKE